MTTYTAEVKAKEVAIRKTLGASVGSIVLKLSMEFIKLVVISHYFGYSCGMVCK
ncbi:hypothetical protein GCM10009119_13230 [Algoriphagus jejuensis]|uniref:Uncharacterized protein n=1 Tax=Algoriphagus jejuensis TaxID=419934 RepID=A0ABN1MYZ1_9BACT